MAENNKLYITITDKRGDGGSGIPTPSPSDSSSAKKEQDEDSALKRYAEHEVFHLVKGTAMKAVNYSISNIGNFTGDYITQKNVDYAKGIVSNMMSVGNATATGAAAGGVVGAVIGFVVGVSSIAIGSVFEEMSNRAENTKNNFNIEMLRERVGLNTIYDGSRGTEN